MIKKRYLFLILIVCLFAVSAVSGAEMGNDTNMEANNDDTGLMAESVNEDVLTVSLNEEEIQGSADNGTFTALQKKIDDAEEDSIIVLENDYKYDSEFSTDGININKKLTINGNGYVIDALSQSRIFNIYSVPVTLKNITFKNGYSSMGGAIRCYKSNCFIINSSFNNNTIIQGDSIRACGGAIYFEDGDLFIKNSIFINNDIIRDHSYDCYGGAIYCKSNNATIINSIFNNNANSIIDYGGAIYVEGENSVIINSTFNNNNARRGGAIYCNGDKAFISNSSFINGYAFYEGAAIYLLSSNCLINNSKFINNSVTGVSRSEGGAIYLNGNNGYVNNSTFINNTAKRGGGAIYWEGKKGCINNSIFSYNIADGRGASGAAVAWWGENGKVLNSYFNFNKCEGSGALFWNAGEGLLYNLFFINNTAHSGGAISIVSERYNISVYDSIFINNTANWGGAISAGDFNLFNSIFINNTANEGGALYMIYNNTIYNSTFINNTALTYGGAISTCDLTYCNLDNSSFIDNNADFGGAIYIKGVHYMPDLKFYKNYLNNIECYNNSAKYGSSLLINNNNTIIDNSLFINNKGTDTGTIHILSDNVTVSKSILINNTDPYDVYSTVYSTVANNNWFGNTLDNQINSPKVSSDIIIDNWHYLDVNTNSKTIKIDENAIINVDLTQLTDNIGKIGFTNELPEIYVNITSANGVCNVSTVKLKDGKTKLMFTPENAGYGSVTISYLTVYQTIDLIIKDNRIEPNMTCNVEDKPVGETVEIDAFLPSDATGNVVVTINNKTYSAKIKNGEAKVLINDLSINKYDFIMDYDGDEKYLFDHVNSTFVINKVSNYTIYSPDVDVYRGETANIIANLPKDATGTANIRIFNENIDDTYSTTVNNGQIILNVDGLLKDAKFIIDYLGDYKYESKSISGSIYVKSIITINAPDVTKYYGGPERFVVTLTDYKGNPISNAKIKININRVDYDRTTGTDGKTSIALSIPAGNYTATVEFDDIKTTSNVVIKSTVTGNDITKIYRNGTQYYAKFVDTKGNILKNTPATFNINGVFYTRTTNENGIAKLNINLSPKKYIITATNPNSGEMYSNVVTVLSNIAENHDLTKYYKNASQYVIRLLDDRGKPVGAGVSVEFNINGVFYTRTSNATGHVKMNVNLNPGTYIITANYKGLMTSNTITVKPILQAKDLSMKYKDGSKFEAKLVDGQGRPFAGQKITFNINGVFYDRTTDDSGIARLNINLMVGEYIITSMYSNGATISNKITIANSNINSNTNVANLKSPEEQYFDILGPNGANGYVYYPDGTYEHFVDDIVVDATHIGYKI